MPGARTPSSFVTRIRTVQVTIPGAVAPPTPETLPPSGEQHEIGHGLQRAVITEIGATLRTYTIDGHPIVDGFGERDICPSGRGQVLAPWPNRLGDGRYSVEGRNAQAALDEPERQCAIHGLVRWLPWKLVSRAQNVVVLGCVLNPQPGYPWRLALSVEYRLGRGGLTIVTEVVNFDQHAAPFGIGFHPYVTVGASGIESARLKVPASKRLVTDERGLPKGATLVAGSEFDFGDGHAVGSTRLDTAFTDLARDVDGIARVELDGIVDRGVTVWMDERFGYVMVYTADTVEPSSRRRKAIAIEPMTCPPDALRSGEDLIRLECGTSWRSAWGIAPRTADQRPPQG
jgi:aldose 1-epimerase